MAQNLRRKNGPPCTNILFFDSVNDKDKPHYDLYLSVSDPLVLRYFFFFFSVLPHCVANHHSYLLQMRFFIDEKYAGELFTRSAIQMVAPGDVYLGGSPDTIRLTDRHVQEGFDGALTEVLHCQSSSFVNNEVLYKKEENYISLY